MPLVKEYRRANGFLQGNRVEDATAPPVSLGRFQVLPGRNRQQDSEYSFTTLPRRFVMSTSRKVAVITGASQGIGAGLEKTPNPEKKPDAA